MQIKNNSSNTFKYNTVLNKNISFQSWRRCVYKNDIKDYENILHRNNTYFFRDGLFWKFLSEFIVEKFKNVSKVNVYSYGCSDGSEAFSFLMRMFGAHEKDSKKFTPIKAVDYDPVAIEKAKSRTHNITRSEKEIIKLMTNYQYNRFITELDSAPTFDYDAPVKINDEIFNNVEFKVANILQDYKNIEPDNSVIFIRNLWPYLDNMVGCENQKKLLKNLHSHLGKNSYIIIGEYDVENTGCQIENWLKEAGFGKTKVQNVFKRLTPEEMNDNEKWYNKLREFFSYLVN